MDTGLVLSANQCLEIGQEAVTRGYYYQAIGWMETAVNKITSENDTTMDLKETEIELDTAKKVVSSMSVKLKFTSPKAIPAFESIGGFKSEHLQQKTY